LIDVNGSNIVSICGKAKIPAIEEYFFNLCPFGTELGNKRLFLATARTIAGGSPGIYRKAGRMPYWFLFFEAAIILIAAF
jgi:hypothetical protein